MLKEVEFFKWLVRGFAAALPSLAIVVAGIAWFGDLLYATQPEIDAMDKRMVSVEKDLSGHIHDDVHMPEAIKRATFVTREEWLSGRDQTSKEFTEVKTMLTGINRLLIERLPKP